MPLLWDGYTMARKGMAAAALGWTLVAALFGGLLSAVVMVTLAQPIANIALTFSTPEYFSLVLFGLASVVCLGGGSQVNAFVSLFIALMERLTDPVRRLLSGFDDYFSWAVVLLPLATGMVAIQQSDPLPLAIHLLSVELLFVWLPFGKLAHAFLVFASRGVTGAALARKGAPL